MDELDTKLLTRRTALFDSHHGPRVGDFVRMLDGTERRFTHDWDDRIQTTVTWDSGSFYLAAGGHMDYSGALDLSIDKLGLLDTHERKAGRAWFFHHDHRKAHNGVDVTLDCRVFRQVHG